MSTSKRVSSPPSTPTPTTTKTKTTPTPTTTTPATTPASPTPLQHEEEEDDGEISRGSASPTNSEMLGDAEEAEEELQDLMVRKIQSIYRARRARILMKQLIKANYVKELDEDTGHFLYRNKRTGEVQVG